LKVIELLLAVGGIQVNNAANSGITPLISACGRGHLKVVEMLLAMDGIQVNQANEKGIKPLYVACYQGHLKVVKMLLAVDGIRVNQVDDKGLTSLYVACHKGHFKVVKMLLAANAIQVNQATNNGSTPLYGACQNGHSKVVKMLLAVDGIQVNQAESNGCTPLYGACQNGHMKVIKMLLAMTCIQPNQAMNSGFTPLMTALNHCHMDIAIQLFERDDIGHNNPNEWFCINKIKCSGRIALYKYALLLPQQHQPLLDFHLCVLSSKNALVPTSALKVFKTIWPPLIGFTIESFLLPTKQTRRTMQHVISRFNATLNDDDEHGRTQLYQATRLADVDTVRFLLLQETILINKFSRYVLRVEGAEGPEDIIRYRTPLHLAERVAGAAAANGRASADEISKRNDVVEVLREAGGTVSTLSREEWLEQQNNIMEIDVDEN
jgi:ankyrin repeat protein